MRKRKRKNVCLNTFYLLSTELSSFTWVISLSLVPAARPLLFGPAGSICCIRVKECRYYEMQKWEKKDVTTSSAGEARPEVSWKEERAVPGPGRHRSQRIVLGSQGLPGAREQAAARPGQGASTTSRVRTTRALRTQRRPTGKAVKEQKWTGPDMEEPARFSRRRASAPSPRIAWDANGNADSQPRSWPTNLSPWAQAQECGFLHAPCLAPTTRDL